ncbi:hypothetical protein AB28_2659 [Raoultella ornithinolytica 2-156-04_S1_C2]|nr:hypothetical protein AB00_2474 [Raoultella ornithinolytica 2-156-04_S1_C1]KDX14556.1 hypothetical protein AB28_2659 [Raoultella ornithinolytica 2-156-04_S1_C2]
MWLIAWFWTLIVLYKFRRFSCFNYLLFICVSDIDIRHIL